MQPAEQWRAGQEADPSTDKSLFPSSLLSSKLEALQEAIQELEVEIRARRALSQDFQAGLRKESVHVQDLLSRLGEPWSKGYLPEMEELRVKLVRELFNLANRERSERLRMWEDIVALKKQRRVFVIEAKALKRTADLLEEAPGGEHG